MATKDANNPAGEVGADEVQAKFDDAAAKGYFGDTPDKESRDNFTLKGVANKKP